MENKIEVPDLVETDTLDLDLFASPRKGKTFELDYTQIINNVDSGVIIYKQKE